MSLYLKVKNDQVEARKANDGVKKNLLTTLLGEASTIAKDSHGGTPSDQEMIATMKKFMNNIDLLLSHSPGNYQAILEKSILVRYLPKQMSEEEITKEIKKFDLTDPKIVGIIMTHFKTNFAGTYDGKLVSDLIKKLKG